MKKKIGIGLAITALLLFGFGILWLGGVFGSKSAEMTNIGDNQPIDNNQNQNGGVRAEDQEITRSNFPANYRTLDQSRSQIPKEANERMIQAFNGVLDDIDKNPRNLRNWYNLGSIKHNFADYLGAEGAWLYTIKADSSFIDSYANLAQLYWHDLPDYPKSEAMFLKVIAINPNSLKAYRDLSDLYRHDYKAKEEKADDILLEGLKNNPDNRDLLIYLAIYYSETEKKDLAITYYERLLEQEPDNKEIQEELVNLKLR